MGTDDQTVFIANSLGQRIPELTDLVRQRLRQDLPEFSADVDPALAVNEASRITAALRSIVDGIRGSSEPGPLALAEAQAEARAVAQAGIELNLLVRTYRLAQAAILDVLLSETNRLVASPGAQKSVQLQVSQIQFDWNETMLTAVVAAYQDARDSFFFHSPDRQLRSMLRSVLAGRSEDIRALNYNIGGRSLAAVVWGERPEQTIEAIRLALSASDVIDVSGSSGARLAWFAISDWDEDILSSRIRDRIPQELGSFVAFGRPGNGVEGFRHSHYQAWRAYRVGRWSNYPLTWYADVALEALFMKDFQAARDFVTQQLGKLDLTDPRTDVLRETLRAYFDSGSNAVRAAQQLQVHERTVSYRLRSIENKLGIVVVNRREELLVALHLESVLRAIARADTLSSTVAMY